MTDAEIKAIERRLNLAKAHGVDVYVCPTCGGDGVYGLADDEVTCPRCLGGKQIRGIIAPQELIEKDVPALLAEVSRLRGPFTCAHDPEHAGGACSACHAEALMKIERLSDDTCDCCAGTGKPESERPCICGGTGLGSDEKIGLRKEVVSVSCDLDAVTQELADLKGKLVVGGMPTPGLICVPETGVLSDKAEIERLKAQVETEHECAGELQEGLSKQYRDSAIELDALEAKLKSANLQNKDLLHRMNVIVEAVDEFCDSTAKDVAPDVVANWKKVFSEFKTGYTEKRSPAIASPCPHDQGWVADGDRDICKRCGSRSNIPF